MENEPKPRGWMARLSLWQRGFLIVGSLFTMGVVWAATLPTVPATDTPTNNSVVASEETKTFSEQVAILHDSTTINDSSLAQGTTQIRQAGKDGEKTITYEVKIQDGVEMSRKVVAEEITIQPVSEIKALGTEAPVSTNAPNGTYKNVDGDIIQSPYHAPSAPAGASAQCGDGTYSFSAHRQGTCSHHGGVARWV